MNLVEQYFSKFTAFDQIKLIQKSSRDELRRSRTNQGDTLLTLICKSYSTDRYRKIKAILDIDPVMAGIPNQKGQTPLLCFCLHNENKHSEMSNIVNLLLSTNHAYPNAQDIYGNTALIYAIVNSFKNAVYPILQTGNANLKAQNNDGYTALMYACQYEYTLLITKMLEQGDCNVGAQGNDRSTALIICCYNKLFTVANKLLETNEAKPELQDLNGNTALIYTCMSENYNFLKKLLRYNSNPGAVNDDGNTALIIALMMGNERIAITLFRAYPDNAFYKNNAGYTAYDYAVQHNFKTITNMLDPALYTLYALKSTVGDELRDTETISNIVDSINENKNGGKKRKQKTRRNKK